MKSLVICMLDLGTVSLLYLLGAERFIFYREPITNPHPGMKIKRFKQNFEHNKLKFVKSFITSKSPWSFCTAISDKPKVLWMGHGRWNISAQPREIACVHLSFFSQWLRHNSPSLGALTYTSSKPIPVGELRISWQKMFRIKKNDHACRAVFVDAKCLFYYTAGVTF